MPPGRGSRSAFMPFQRVSFSGSTKNSQTVSGLAAIEIVRSTEVVSVVASMLLPLLLLRFAFECFQSHVPELLEELLELGEPFRTCSVKAPRAVPSLAHEPRLLQDVQVLGDRGPRDVEVRRDLAGAQLVVADEREDLTAPGRGDRFQCGLHAFYVSRFLRKKQLNFRTSYSRLKRGSPCAATVSSASCSDFRAGSLSGSRTESSIPLTSPRSFFSWRLPSDVRVTVCRRRSLGSRWRSMSPRFSRSSRTWTSWLRSSPSTSAIAACVSQAPSPRVASTPYWYMLNPACSNSSITRALIA